MGSLPTWSTFSGKPYDARALLFEVGDLRVWFSYLTPIAFHDGIRLYVRQNDWKGTTGKHLNMIDGGDKPNNIRRERLTGSEFETLLGQALERV